MNEQYLQHHGVLGMRWGIRRYQNPDGTYTTLGKLMRKMKKEDYSEDYKKAHDKKKVEYMSTEELQSRYNRLNLERNYKNVRDEDKRKREEAAEKKKEQIQKVAKKVFLDPIVDYAASQVRDRLGDAIDIGIDFANDPRIVSEQLSKVNDLFGVIEEQRENLRK